MTVDSDLLLVPPTSQPPTVAAVDRVCSECSRPVWVSLAMVPVVDAGGVRPWCFGCAAASGRDIHPKQHPVQAADGQGVGEFDQMAAGVLDQVRAARRG